MEVGGDEWQNSWSGRFTPGEQNAGTLLTETRWTPEQGCAFWRTKTSCPCRYSDPAYPVRSLFCNYDTIPRSEWLKNGKRTYCNTLQSSLQKMNILSSLPARCISAGFMLSRAGPCNKHV